MAGWLTDNPGTDWTFSGDNNEIASRPAPHDSSNAILSATTHSSGKMYVEIHGSSTTNSWWYSTFGIYVSGKSNTVPVGNDDVSWGFKADNNHRHDNANTGTGDGGFSSGHANIVFQIAVDIDNNKLWLGVNGVWQSGDPATDTSPSFTDTDITGDVGAAIYVYTSNNTATIVESEADFTYSVPTGFSAWAAQAPSFDPSAAVNKATLTLDDPSETLTDFPVKITLGGAVGKNDFDLSQAITDLFVGSDFTPKLAIEQNGSQCSVEIAKILFGEADVWDSTNVQYVNTSGKLEKTVTGGWGNERITQHIDSNTDVYWEFDLIKSSTHDHYMPGIISNVNGPGSYPGGTSDSVGYYCSEGQVFNTNAAHSTYGDKCGAGDNIAFAFKGSTGELYIRINGVWQGSSDPVAGTNPAFEGLTGTYYPAIGLYYPGMIVNLRGVPKYEMPEGFDYIDTDPPEVELFVKVPTYNTDNKELELSWDKDQPDNSTNVGDTGAPPAQNVWSNGYAAVYHFAQDPVDGTASILDSTANANHGTPTVMNDQLSNAGLYFQGGNSFIDVPDSDSLDLGGGVNYTIGVQLNPDDTTRGGIVHKVDGGYDGYMMVYSYSAGKMAFWSSETSAAWESSTTSMTTGTMQYSSAKPGQFYLNGSPDGTNAQTNTPLVNETDLRIGKDYNGNCFQGYMKELWLSSVERSDEWEAKTSDSLADNLITFSAADAPIVLTPASMLFVQAWSYELDVLIAVLHQPYNLANNVLAIFEQVYGLRMHVTLQQVYHDAPVIKVILRQHYGNTSIIRRVLQQTWGRGVSVQAAFEQGWLSSSDIRMIVEQAYKVAGADARLINEQQWNIAGVTPVSRALAMPWALLGGDDNEGEDGGQVDYDVGSTTPVPIDPTNPGAGIVPVRTGLDPISINIEADLGQYCWSCDLTTARVEDFTQCAPLTDLDIEIEGQTFSFFVESRRRSRKPGQSLYYISALSRTALLDAPYAQPIQEEFTGGMASAIVTELAGRYDITVVWDLVDAYIPVDTLFANDETPLAVIRKLVNAMGGILQSNPAGALWVRPAYPVSVPQWNNVAPDHYLDDLFHFVSIEEQPVTNTGFNVFHISDQLTARENVRLEEETLSRTTKEIRCYQTPWDESISITLRTSGGTWVNIEPQPSREEVITETVEIVGGAGQTSKPIYSIIDRDWAEESLGVVSFSEDGTLETEVAGESLLEITYITRYRLWRATDPRIEDVQFVADVDISLI